MQVKKNRSTELWQPQWCSSCSHGTGGYRQLCNFFTLVWTKCSVSFAPPDRSAELTGAGPYPELMYCFPLFLTYIANKINPRDRHCSCGIPCFSNDYHLLFFLCFSTWRLPKHLRKVASLVRSAQRDLFTPVWCELTRSKEQVWTGREQCYKRRVLSTYLVFPNRNTRDNLLEKNVITHLHVWLG